MNNYIKLELSEILPKLKEGYALICDSSENGVPDDNVIYDKFFMCFYLVSVPFGSFVLLGKRLLNEDWDIYDDVIERLFKYDWYCIEPIECEE